MVTMRRDEHHRRRVDHLLQRSGQLQAVAAGHANIQQHGVTGCGVRGGTRLGLQPGQCLVGRAGFGHDQGRRLALFLQQQAQAGAGQGLVVHQQDAQRQKGVGHRA